MRLEKEIERAIKYLAAFNADTNLSQKEIDTIAKQVSDVLKSNQYNFSGFKSMNLKQNKKIRIVKYYDDIYSSENILCQCIKQILDRIFKVKYPNRNAIIKELFSILPAVKTMCDFTIVKFDFNDYFNSVSATYVFEKYLKSRINNRFEMDLIKKFISDTKFTYAGLSTSNVIAEIVAKHFDEVLLQALANKGIIFFERYIDDSIIVFNENVNETEIKEILNNVLVDVFHDATINVTNKCKTIFNNKKFKIISKRLLSSTPCSLDYLGYEFFFFNDSNQKTKIQYGITKEKQNKYRKRIRQFISCYLDIQNQDYQDLELLRQRVLAFSSRVVYLNKKFKTNVWKVKGFISNYGELRYLLCTEMIHADTLKFLKEMILEEFCKSNIPQPYFLKDNSADSGYSLFNNMNTNKTILLVEHIGYDNNSLIKLCKKIKIPDSFNGSKRGYGTLVREYLIKIKVGY